MATSSLVEGIIARLDAELEGLIADEKVVKEAIRQLRDTVRTLRGSSRPNAGPARRTTRSRRRHPVLAPPDAIAIVTQRGAHNELAILEYLEDGELHSFSGMYDGMGMNSGTASGVLDRLVKAKLVERTDFNAYRILDKGRSELERVRRMKGEAQPEPEPEAEKPEPPKPKRRRDSRPREEKFADIDDVLRAAGPRGLSYTALGEKAKVHEGFVRKYQDELVQRKIMEFYRVEDLTLPRGYRVFYRTPQRETVAHAGVDVHPGRRLPE